MKGTLYLVKATKLMDEKQEVLLIKSYKFFQFISSIQI